MIVEHDNPVICQRRFLSLQVCVPEGWDDAKVTEWTNREDLCGTTNGWQIGQAGGDPVRVKCEGRNGFVHIIMEA